MNGMCINFSVAECFPEKLRWFSIGHVSVLIRKNIHAYRHFISLFVYMYRHVQLVVCVWCGICVWCVCVCLCL